MSKLVLTEEETMLGDMARGFLDGAAPVSAFRKMRDAGQTHDAKLWKEMADMGWSPRMRADRTWALPLPT